MRLTEKQTAQLAEQLLTALAIVEQADATLLSTMINNKLTLELLQAVELDADVSQAGGVYLMAAGAAQQRRRVLEQEQYTEYKRWHQQAATLLAERLVGGETAVEPYWCAVYQRLASLLVGDAPQKFIDLVREVEALPLRRTPTRHWHQYFAGVAYGLEEQFDKAIATLTSLLAEPTVAAEIRGRALNSRAVFYRHKGQIELAYADFFACLHIWAQLGNQQRRGFGLNNLCFLACQLQRYEAAEAYGLEAVALLEPLQIPSVYLAYMNLGILYRDLGRWEEATAWQEKALALQQQIEAADMAGRTLINLGELLLLNGELAAALPKFEAAIAAMSTRIWEVDAHLDRGLVLQVWGRLAEAEAAFRQAVAVAQEIGRQEVLAEAHYRLATFLGTSGEPTAAFGHFIEAVRVIESARAPMENEGLKVSLLGRWQQVYEALVLHLLAQGQVVAAFAWAEKARARAFAEGLAVVETTTAVSLQQALPPDTVLVSYFTTGVLEHDVPMLQAIPKDNPLRRYLLPEAKTIRFVISPTQITADDCGLNPNLLTSRSRRGEDAARFWEPRFVDYLSPRLLGRLPDARQLVIVPHGPLHRLPFSSLHHDKGYELLYAPSATVLAQQLGRTGEKTAVFAPSLVVGYHGTAEPLRYVAAEVAAVAERLGGVAQSAGVVDRQWLRETAVSTRVLHFACHGRFNASDPLASYLEIGAGTLLSAREVLETWQIRAALVTLSACQSGVSRVLRSDEPMGLIRAFLYAGAQAVLVTHWPVEDLPTFLLMDRFYALWQRHGAAARALREAQRWLRQVTVRELSGLLTSLPGWQHDLPQDGMGDEERPFVHQRHWAAFTLYGQPVSTV